MSSMLMRGISCAEPTLAVRTASRNTSVGAGAPSNGCVGSRYASSSGSTESWRCFRQRAQRGLETREPVRIVVDAFDVVAGVDQPVHEASSETPSSCGFITSKDRNPQKAGARRAW